MSLRFTAHGSLDEFKTLFNILSESELCLDIKTHPAHKGKDLETGSQTFVLSLKPSGRYERTPKERVPQAGFVYLLPVSEGRYKIGKTIDPTSRLETFKLNIPSDMMNYEVIVECSDMDSVEKGLHRRFARKKVKGTKEFFDLDERDVEYIRGLA